jgi:hypothetical protein
MVRHCLCVGESALEEDTNGLLLTGGRDSSLNSLSSVEFFGSDQCFVPALPEPRSGHVTFVTPGGAVASCGGLVGGVKSTQCVVLNITGQQWDHGVLADLAFRGNEENIL